jgi:two-component sensor histidine kinase
MAQLPHQSAHRQIDAVGLRAILETCRLDVDTARHIVSHDSDRAFHDGDRGIGATNLERRLNHLAERLERATRMLDLIVGSDSLAAAVPATAYLLVREADHRINNSLQTVISLLNQQAIQAEAQAVRDALRVASARVAAIAAVHASLKQHGDLGTYLPRLCAALRDALGMDGVHRILQVEVEPLAISPAAAQSLGLAVTELVTNALRHAFEPMEPGTVRVNGQYRGDWYQLTIEDNGKGLPHGFDLAVQQSGHGLRMVSMLADTVRARLTAGGRRGARFVFTLPVEYREDGRIGKLGARRLTGRQRNAGNAVNRALRGWPSFEPRL